MPNRTSISFFVCLTLALLPSRRAAAADDPPPITFNLNFEGASLGNIEKLDETTFRCHVEGQHDERGHNRQASWYYFRLDHVRGREITLTLTDFVGEYNDKAGAVAMGPDIFPVFSDDGVHWRHFDAMTWDAAKKEATLKFTPAADRLWIAHIPPYTASDLGHLLHEIADRPDVLIEVIGKTAGGREIPLVTVTNRAIPDAGKKTVWLQARQHAWEAGTSYVMEGALRFITSDAPAAKQMRDRVVFRFTPMVDLDGCAGGKVRFNANGYDVNRHWAQVDLREAQWLKLMPEIWYTKKAIIAEAKNGRGIDLMVNMHNTETSEFLSTEADDEAVLKVMRRFEILLAERTTFDASKPLAVTKLVSDDTNSLFRQAKVPVMLMEQRISPGKKLGRRPTTEDRWRFGETLIQVMAAAVLGE